MSSMPVFEHPTNDLIIMDGVGKNTKALNTRKQSIEEGFTSTKPYEITKSKERT